MARGVLARLAVGVVLLWLALTLAKGVRESVTPVWEKAIAVLGEGKAKASR